MPGHVLLAAVARGDRKSTRLNSSHANISYAVFCLKKKKTVEHRDIGSSTTSDTRLRQQRCAHHGHPVLLRSVARHVHGRVGDCRVCFFFFNDPATTEIYTLSLHDALPI